PQSKVACETLVTTGQVVLAGEVKSTTYLDLHKIARDVINRIGYNKSEYMFEAHSCGILSSIHEQSADINQGVERQNKEEQGAGDQGMMFGYATNETDNFMPLALDLAHRILLELSSVRKEGKVMKYLRPDAKSQVTIEYSDDNKPLRIDSIVVSTQHDEFILAKNGLDEDRLRAQKAMQSQIKGDIIKIVLPRVIKKLKPTLKKLFTDDIKYHINPTGNFVIGGPHGDTGLTGRKIIVDTYGGKGAHGGGAFSGKDPSKVDRSGAYATRHIAKNLVAAGICDEVLVQVSYAIGIAEPTNIYVNTFGSSHVKLSDSQIAEKVKHIFPMRPYDIEQRLKLRKPIYSETASYGHMGRTPELKEVTFYDGSGRAKKVKFETFTWEKLDMVKDVQKAFNLR
ncbi:MAG TPA: methionine adenosyltransferase, partial [Saprospiraceae bacterium]|nr:methionine adenosyltransferase [Saprospiraceae bacterium]